MRRDLHQLREVWTKNLKICPVEDDDVEMTREGEGSGESSRDEEYFEKQMCLTNESHEVQVRPSRSGGYVKSPVDQFEEWILENPIPYISNDNFSQKDIFHCCHDQLTGHVLAG